MMLELKTRRWNVGRRDEALRALGRAEALRWLAQELEASCLLADVADLLRELAAEEEAAAAGGADEEGENG